MVCDSVSAPWPVFLTMVTGPKDSATTTLGTWNLEPVEMGKKDATVCVSEKNFEPPEQLKRLRPTP